MSIEGDMRERHGRVLAELAEAGMVMVRRLGEAMARTEDVQTQAQLGLAFHRVSRAVRQTLALEFRLMQEARRENHPPAPARTPPPEPRPPRPPVERTGWNEYESSDSDETLDALDDLLEAEDIDPDAVHEAVETCLLQIRRDLDADRDLVASIDLRPAGRISFPAGEARPAPAAALAHRPPSDPGGRRSQLLGGAAITPPRPAARPAGLPWRSSA